MVKHSVINRFFFDFQVRYKCFVFNWFRKKGKWIERKL